MYVIREAFLSVLLDFSKQLPYRTLWATTSVCSNFAMKATIQCFSRNFISSLPVFYFMSKPFAQRTFTCSKLTVEQGVKYVQS